jgi:hypothetical protein
MSFDFIRYTKFSDEDFTRPVPREIFVREYAGKTLAGGSGPHHDERFVTRSLDFDSTTQGEPPQRSFLQRASPSHSAGPFSQVC